jgi:hypothetical protein
MVTKDFPDAIMITVVLDNLNTHNEKSLYETFTPLEVKKY